ncbi:autophagy- protein 2 [Coemansia thaxteri]|nr:autophagy- protein 2 [Coemansia thaxteri]KAJ2471056.1 autophagy- protein 2 [Coemansia sp. RSA 2322]
MWPSSWSVSLPSWAVSNTLQKRLVKFLLRRTIGQFLKTELEDEHLDVQLSSGQLRLKNALNDAVAGLPILVRSGVVGTVLVSVPWTQLWTGHCELQIEDLVLKTQLADEDADHDSSVGDEGGNDKNSAAHDFENRLRSGRTNMAESIAMTEGGASILASSVFIADDFLRAETLGYGEKDEIFISKDVERLVANAHEERAQYYRQRGQAADHSAPFGNKRRGYASATGQRAGKQQPAANDSDNAEEEFEDCASGLPRPGSPGGPVRGLQVVSEMVDRIVSAINISVRNVTVECAVATRDECAKEVTNTLRLTVDSIRFLDDKAGHETESGSSTESPSRRGHHSNNSSGGDSGSDHDHPMGIEYKVVEIGTLHKLLEIKGLRLTLQTSLATDGAQNNTVASTFGAPLLAHLRIHRRMPFSELAPVQPKDSGGSSRRHRRRSGADDSVYMGPMPGEFREAKLGQSPPATSSAGFAAGARIRNNSGEEPTTSGWDVSLDLEDLACVFTERQLACLVAIVQAAAPLVAVKSERAKVRNWYQNRYGDVPAVFPGDLLPQLARWISIKCKRVYVAVVPHAVAPLEAWQNNSLAILRLKLETVKHLALYLKGIGARWESMPTSGTKSAPSGSAVYMGTEVWAAATRETTARAKGQFPADASPMSVGSCATTVVAYIQNFSVYDNDPKVYPVVRPLVSIDRSLVDARLRHEQAGHANVFGKELHRCDVWLRTSDSDAALTVNVGPIVFSLNKELADRLAMYNDIIAIIMPAGVDSSISSESAATAAGFDSHSYKRSGVAESIENLMDNLKIQAEQKMPLNIAVCSPLIRTWILLPSTTGCGGSGSSGFGSQARMPGKDSTAAPGHFCIDAIDAVITNVVNGTAASSQSQDDVPEGHMRHPHVQELLESRKSVAGSGVRVECNALHVYVQTMEGSGDIAHIASAHSPSDVSASMHEAVSIPRPHVEITTVAKPGYHPTGPNNSHYPRQRPPAFDAFAAVDDDIRVRMAPESELTTSLEFERQAVAQSRLVVSCHLPEAEIELCRTTYQRLNAVINEFMLWQSVQEEAAAATAFASGSNNVQYDIARTEASGDLGISVLVDVPMLVAAIDTSTPDVSYHSRGKANQPAKSESQRARLVNTQVFISNALVEKGRTYASVESNQVRLSSFEGESEIEAVVSHSFATPAAPIITPQLSLYLLSSPSITRESEIVLKTAWTTFDYHNESACFRELEAFFSSSGTSGLVQPPPKPMRLSLNVLNSSFRWIPASDPSICNAVLSLDSLAVIVGINTPVPDRDHEELHYYIEGLSVFGKSTDSLISTAIDISSDAWVSTGRFWKDHGYAVLVHMDMVDVASRSREGDDGPLVDMKLYSEALVLDACADSVGSLPLLIRGLIDDIKGSNSAKQDAAPLSKKRPSSPQVLGQPSNDIFGDVEEDTFASASFPNDHQYQNFPLLTPVHRPGHTTLASRRSIDSQNFTYDFENGCDDIGALVMDEYFATAAPPDAAEEYEVVANNALSPLTVAKPAYTRHAQQTAYVPMSPPAHTQISDDSLRQQPLDIRPSKGASRGKERDVGIALSGDFTGAEEDDSFDLHGYVNMDSDGDLFSEDETGLGADFERVRGSRPSSSNHHSMPRNLFSRQQFAADGSVVFEPDYSSPKLAAHRSIRETLPRVRMIDNLAQGGAHPVLITVPSAANADCAVENNAQSSDVADIGKGFRVIDDYFKAPVADDSSSDDGAAPVGAIDHILCLTIDVARVQVNLYSGQDWFVAPESNVLHQAVDPGYMPSYMDNLNDDAGTMGESAYGHVAASMPESRGPYMRRSSNVRDTLQSPRGPSRPLPRPARRSAKPKIELRATHVHAEYKQFSETSATAYGLGLNVSVLEILDELESSEWSKFLTRRRDAKTGLPATLQSLANPRNRQLFTKGTADSDRVTSSTMRRQRSSRWPSNNAEPMICAQVESVRPYPNLPTEELRVDVEVSPIRCYIHQDALDFLIGFFETSEQHSAALLASNAKSSQHAPEHAAGPSKRVVLERRYDQYSRRQRENSAGQPYFQIVRIAPINVIFDYKPRRLRALSGSKGSSRGYTQVVAASTLAGANTPGAPAANVTAPSAPPPVSSPSRKPVELLNFFPLEDAEMTLSTVKVRGVAGVSKLVRELGRSWLPHLTQTQIPGVVSGMTPLRSLVNIGSGFADLVILPLEQYRRDGRLVQGIKRGAQSFARTTALEAIQLGAKVAVNAQTLLEQAGDILNVDISTTGETGSAPHSHDGADSTGGISSNHPQIVFDLADLPDYMSSDGHSVAAAGSEYGGGGGSASGSGVGGRRGSFNKSKYARQPENLSEGMRQAYMSLRSNMGDAVQTILAIPVVVQESIGEDGTEGAAGDSVPGRSPVHGSVRAVVRAVPVAVLKPMIGATEAVSKTLLGLRNTMEPTRRGQLEDKYKSRSLGAKKSYPS